MIRIILSLLLLVAPTLWCQSPAPDAKPLPKRLSLDLFAGLETVSPDDLNRFTEYQQSLYTYLSGYYLGQNSQYHRVTDLGSPSRFESLKRSWSLAGRLRYTLGHSRRGTSLSLGLSYQQGAVDSMGEIHVTYDDFYQGSYEVHRSLSPLKLWVESWSPLIGFHLPLLSGGPFRAEAMVAMGPLWGSCGTFKADLLDKQEELGYRTRTESIRRLSGSGTGLAAELGLRIDYAPLKAAALFLEGGYTLRRIGRIHGEAAYITNTRDNNEDGFRSEYTWEDDWVLATDNTGRLPLVRYDGLSAVSIDDFTLDLSAFYLRAGIRLALF